MKRFGSLLALVLIVGCTARAPSEVPAPPAPTVEATPDPALRLLFIGNSYTFSHELPRVLEQIAAATDGGPSIQTVMVAEPGWTLEQHWQDRRALARVRDGGWSHVVLQGHSLATVQQRDGLLEYARRFDSAIGEVGATTVLFMTWARREHPQMLEAVSGGYEHVGRTLGATVVPAGLAWGTSWERRPDIHLWHSDGSHPSPAGTYLAAATFYSVLTGRSSAGADHAGFGQLDVEEIRALQETAHEVASGYSVPPGD